MGAHPGVKLSRGPGGQGKPLQDLADLQGALLGTKKQAVEYKKCVSKLKSEMYRKRRKLVGQRTFQSTRPFEWGHGARAGAVGVREQIGPPVELTHPTCNGGVDLTADQLEKGGYLQRSLSMIPLCL